MRDRRALLFGAALMVCALITTVQPSTAATTVYVVTRGYSNAQANTGGELAVRTVPIVEGSTLILINTQLWGHSIVSDDFAAPNVRLFRSDIIGFRGQAEVVGVDRLPPSTYRFHCLNHPDMTGEIIVLPKEGI